MGWCNMCFGFVLVVLWVSCFLFGFVVVLISGFGLVWVCVSVWVLRDAFGVWCFSCWV